jgi:short-subunit dehydrogenase
MQEYSALVSSCFVRQPALCDIDEYSAPLMDLPNEDLRSTFDVNVFGILKLTQAVAPHMAARKKGLIINIGSVSGIV